MFTLRTLHLQRIWFSCFWGFEGKKGNFMMVRPGISWHWASEFKLFHSLPESLSWKIGVFTWRYCSNCSLLVDRKMPGWKEEMFQMCWTLLCFWPVLKWQFILIQRNVNGKRNAFLTPYIPVLVIYNATFYNDKVKTHKKSKFRTLMYGCEWMGEKACWHLYLSGSIKVAFLMWWSKTR